MRSAAPVAMGRTADLTVTPARATALGFAFLVPTVAALAALYAAAWGGDAVPDALRAFFGAPGSLAAFAGAVAVHEGVHGAAWAGLTGRPLSDVRFGFNVRALMPYAHARFAMPARAYRLGAAAPGVLLGLGPALAGAALGSGYAFAFGLALTAAAAGDAVVLWLLRGVPGGALVQDHPTLPGCRLVRPA